MIPHPVRSADEVSWKIESSVFAFEQEKLLYAVTL